MMNIMNMIFSLLTHPSLILLLCFFFFFYPLIRLWLYFSVALQICHGDYILEPTICLPHLYHRGRGCSPLWNIVYFLIVKDGLTMVIILWLRPVLCTSLSCWWEWMDSFLFFMFLVHVETILVFFCLGSFVGEWNIIIIIMYLFWLD